MYIVYTLAGLCLFASASLDAVCCRQSVQAYLKIFRSTIFSYITVICLGLSELYSNVSLL